MDYKFSGKVWLWSGKAAWHFITLPKDISQDIKTNFGDNRPGWGAVPVEVKIGSTAWKTSIFPDKKLDAYLLPLKSEIRKKTSITAGDTAKVSISLQIQEL
jgi:hypothetical protein